jgi:DNA polymerase
MEEFDEQQLASLINEALAGKDTNSLFPSNDLHLSYMDSNILTTVFDKVSKYMPISEAAGLLQDIRDELLTRKISLSLKDLHTVTNNCKKCKIDSSAELPKWNVQNPDVVIVIESPAMDPQAISYMVDIVKQVGFSSNQLCLTYLNRCPKRDKYNNEEIINCAPYLHTEIQLLNPKLILTIGALPASALFGSEIKLKDYRGNITWLGNWPILPTYSPSYALKAGGSTLEHFSEDIAQAYQFIYSKKKDKS